jgi:hypothetical protein
MTRQRIKVVMIALAFLALGGVSVHALDLIVNGSFESGNLEGWTIANQDGSNGNWFTQSGELSPLSGTFVPGPPKGLFAAMTDQTGPGTHVLYQDIVIPGDVGGPPTSYGLAFDYYLGNRANSFSSPDSLNFDVSPNQQVRVDLLRSGANPLSVASDDVLVNVLRTLSSDPPSNVYNAINFSISVDATTLSPGQTVRLRFAQVNNQGPFQFGLDNVQFFSTAIPEPASITLVGIALMLCLIKVFGRPPIP